jgi:hypothetical protein
MGGKLRCEISCLFDLGRAGRRPQDPGSNDEPGAPSVLRCKVFLTQRSVGAQRRKGWRGASWVLEEWSKELIAMWVGDSVGSVV